MAGAIIFSLICVVIFAFLRKVFFSGPKPQAGDGGSRETFAKYGLGFRRQTQRALVVKKPKMELNEQNRHVLNILENTNRNVFLTGKAGSGKSTLLKYFRATTRKNVAVVAPTGVAAINVQGQTVHRFFRFKPDITPDKVPKYLDRNKQLYKKLDTLIIDEISMVRADLLDCVDAFLKLHGPKPGQVFGGVQVIMIGDLYQLPPVVKDEEEEIFQGFYSSEFFFAAKCLQDTNLTPLELTKVYRQTDQRFIDILNAIREGSVSDEQLEILNSRVDRNLDYAGDDAHVRIWLVPTKSQAAEINGWHMTHLPGESRTYQGLVDGKFEERTMPTSLELELKVGTQVMLLNNDSRGKWVNGSVAKIISLAADSIRVIFADGTFDDVERHTWDSFSHTLDPKTGKIVALSEGSFTQFPLKPAWSLTIHKAQGQTYDDVVLDFGHGTFAPGQAYVGLSRCRSLEGLILKTPLKRKHVFMDPKAHEFMYVVSELAKRGHVPRG